MTPQFAKSRLDRKIRNGIWHTVASVKYKSYLWVPRSGRGLDPQLETRRGDWLLKVFWLSQHVETLERQTIRC